MRFLFASLVGLIFVLAGQVYELENRAPQIVRTPAAEELPYAIGVTLCDEPYALVWTTEPPTWFTPEDDFDAEQMFKMQAMIFAGQYQDLDITGTICSAESI